MTSFETSKILGGVGSILVLLGVVPYVNSYGIIMLIGAILLLFGLHGLSDYYRDQRIFRNAIFGIAAGVIGVVAAIGAGIIALLLNLGNIEALIYQLYPGWNGDWATLQNLTPDPNAINAANFDVSTLIPFVIAVFAVLAILWLFAMISTFFIRRSFKAVSEKSSVGTFGTAGLLLLIGAVLIIAFGLGVILMWIAVLILAVAFFQLRPAEPVVPVTDYSTPATLN